MRFMSKVILSDNQRMYIQNYDRHKLIETEIDKDQVLKSMPTNLSNKESKLTFADIISKMLKKEERHTQMTEMDQKIMGQIVKQKDTNSTIDDIG
mmetsp:Transcript_18514/g.16395  ORF Transcript_18514/g.16395 Transcript_18514/m.16395 type:complete len:95 (-) Transcript_18514:16-300(-)